MGLTIEELAVELGKVVELLEARLRDDEVEQFLRELGLPAPETITQVAGVVSEIQSIAAEVAPLPSLIVRLTNAIADEDLDEIKDLAEDLIPVVRSIVDATPDLAQAVEDAAAAAGSESGAVVAFAAKLPERLLGYLVASYLEIEHPSVYAVSVIFGLMDRMDVDASNGAVGHTRHTLRLDRLSRILQDPTGLLTERHGLGNRAGVGEPGSSARNSSPIWTFRSSVCAPAQRAPGDSNEHPNAPRVGGRRCRNDAARRPCRSC